MWDTLKKIDRVLMAIARPFVWLYVILIAIGFMGGLINAILMSHHPAQTLIRFLFALIVVVLLAVIVWLVRRRYTK